MKINQDNYEQYFLDHAEGNLSPEMERELSDFLESNPDLKPLLDAFDPSPLQTEEIRNEALKRKLKRRLHPTQRISETNIDEWMIGSVEGLLSEMEEEELKEFLALNPAYAYDLKLFGLTRLVPDPAITFTRKRELKKRGLILPVYRLAWLMPAAAAVILLFIGIRYFQSTESEISTHSDTPETLSTVKIPEADIPVIETIDADKIGTPSTGTPSTGTPSAGTPSAGTPSHESRPEPFRLNPSVADAINVQSPSSTLEINLPAYNFEPIQTTGKKEKPFIARAFGNIIAQVSDGISNRAKRDKNDKPDFSFWSIAKAGVEGYNSLSDRDLELYVNRDEAGKVKSYSLIEDDRLLLSRDFNKQ